MLLAAAVVALIVRDGDETGGDSGEVIPCPDDGTWTALDVADTTPVQHAYASQAADLDIPVVGARTRPRDGGTMVLVDVEVANRNEPAPGIEDEFYFGLGDLDGIVVDGFDQGDAYCMHTSTHAQLEPGERTVGTIGYRTAVADPSGLPIILEGFDDLDLVVVDPPAG